MLQTDKESKNSSFIKLLLQMWQSVAFLYFSQSSAVITIGFGAAKLSLIFTSPAECHLKTFPLRFHPCKLLVLKLHRHFSQPCKNNHLPRDILFSWCNVSLYSHPQAHKEKSFY